MLMIRRYTCVESTKKRKTTPLTIPIPVIPFQNYNGVGNPGMLRGVLWRGEIIDVHLRALARPLRPRKNSTATSGKLHAFVHHKYSASGDLLRVDFCSNAN